METLDWTESPDHGHKFKIVQLSFTKKANISGMYSDAVPLPAIAVVVAADPVFSPNSGQQSDQAPFLWSMSWTLAWESSIGVSEITSANILGASYSVVADHHHSGGGGSNKFAFPDTDHLGPLGGAKKRVVCIGRVNASTHITVTVSFQSAVSAGSNVSAFTFESDSPPEEARDRIGGGSDDPASAG